MKPTAILSLALLAVPALAGGGPVSPADFATTVLAYSGTNGVYGFDRPEDALGPPSRDALPAVPDNSSVVSFGSGGYLTLGFSRPITNDPRHPGGYDFIVFGNAFYAGGDEEAPNREPGYVLVGVDPSGDHRYGDGSSVVWYWLKGSPAPATLGGFPMAMPALSETVWGYADCTPTDGAGDPLVPDDPFTAGITPGTAGGDAFDLDWAVDENGAPVHLEYADFVRIGGATNGVSAVTGRESTEVDAVSLVRPRVMGDVDYSDSVTLADAVLTLRAASNLATLDDEQTVRADLNADGSITAADAGAALRLAAGLGRKHPAFRPNPNLDAGCSMLNADPGRLFERCFRRTGAVGADHPPTGGHVQDVVRYSFSHWR